MTRTRFAVPFLLAALVAFGSAPAFAQSGTTIDLTVDAAQAPLKLLRTQMEMPVAPGPLTLYYPKWIPGEHEPSGPISQVTGLKFTANGKTIPWTRDLYDVFTFHLDIPAGVSRLGVAFDYIEPSAGGGGPYSAGSSDTDKLVIISWNQNVLYPAGVKAEQITMKTKLLLPDGWKFGTPLPVASQSGNAITFQPASLNRLVDSPVIAGEFYRAIDLTPPGEPIHHEIDMVSDSAAALDMSPDVQKGMTNLVAESGALFGTRHYRDYHFLFTLSNHVAHFGLEHHESNDSRLNERALLSPGAARAVGSLLSHEFMHSWNGKFRRPADLSTPYYEAPEATDLLWVYEGLTDFLGPMLAARSGLWTPEQYHSYLAELAASLGPGRPGRTWRPLLDTAIGEPGVDSGGGWFTWKRGTDYYEEGDLLWLEVATIIHRESRGAKSIDDFCHIFYAGPNNGPELKTYTLDDVVRTLNEVAPYNWAEFFHERLTSTSPDAPVGGIENGGWKVTYSGSASGGRGGGGRGGASLTYSLGLDLGGDGTVRDSIYGGPAFKAGVTSGMKVVGVNGRVYTADGLNDAIRAAQDTAQPIQLLVVDDDYYKTCTLDYRGGERFPELVRDSSKPDYLDELIGPHAKTQ